MSRPALTSCRVRRAKPETHWRRDAACRDEDPELFFPVGKGEAADLQAARAVLVCERCPVISECRQWALDAPIALYGVWGGTTEEERAALIRDRSTRGNL